MAPIAINHAPAARVDAPTAKKRTPEPPDVIKVTSPQKPQRDAAIGAVRSAEDGSTPKGPSTMTGVVEQIDYQNYYALLKAETGDKIKVRFHTVAWSRQPRLSLGNVVKCEVVVHQPHQYRAVRIISVTA